MQHDPGTKRNFPKATKPCKNEILGLKTRHAYENKENSVGIAETRTKWNSDLHHLVWTYQRKYRNLHEKNLNNLFNTKAPYHIQAF